jgi:hypothetical protein
MKEDSKHLKISKITSISFAIPSPLNFIGRDFHSYLRNGRRL